MNLSFKLKTQVKNTNGESPLYLRLRFTDSKNKTTESSIFTGIEISPKHFKNGNLIIRTPNYSNRKLTLDSIVLEIEKITYFLVYLIQELFFPHQLYYQHKIQHLSFVCFHLTKSQKKLLFHQDI